VPTVIDGPMATIRKPSRFDGRHVRPLLLLTFTLGLLGGCGSSSGRDPGLTIGGRARLISVDGNAASLEVPVTSNAKGGRAKKSSSPVKFETLSVPNGTEVIVLAIDGSDARIRLEGAEHAGLITWVESAKLEPVKP